MCGPGLKRLPPSRLLAMHVEHIGGVFGWFREISRRPRSTPLRPHGCHMGARWTLIMPDEAHRSHKECGAYTSKMDRTQGLCCVRQAEPRIHFRLEGCPRHWTSLPKTSLPTKTANNLFSWQAMAQMTRSRTARSCDCHGSSST